ncbi:MAG: hypothetical protein H0Z39_03480 [Peptococcaceae bacterium]|nr:hypothetical protein [Peptococcaceae bacterium]
MLHKVIATFGALFIILGVTLSGALLVGMIGQWYVVTNQAQFLAESQGKYGGYTTEAEAAMQQFYHDYNLDPSEVDVYVSAPGGPVPWGTVVTARITVPFKFQVGSFMTPFEVLLTGYGRSVSTYLPGSYDVTYTSPS